MPQWSTDEWQYLERQVVVDPQGRQWSIGLMDVLGQAGDPDMPHRMLELEYASGRYFTLIYSPGGSLQWERGYPTLAEAMHALRTPGLGRHRRPRESRTTRVPSRSGRLTTCAATRILRS